MKIHPMGIELFHPERRTDIRTEMTKPIVAFHNFANASNKETWLLLIDITISEDKNVIMKLKFHPYTGRLFKSTYVQDEGKKQSIYRLGEALRALGV
jgi:hypothetical protein